MRLLFVLLLTGISLYAVDPPTVFHNCILSARVANPNGTLYKSYKCSGFLVGISGTWSSEHHELDQFWFGETADFGFIAGSANQYTNCKRGPTQSNATSYLSLSADFECKEGRIRLYGKWGEEIQGHWEYHLEFGEVIMEPSWVSDPIKFITDATYERWCPTRYGFRLCGWINEPKVDHGTPPRFKR